MATSNRPDLIEKLTDGIARLTTTDEWQRFLDYQSRFHHYSASNVLLIMLQTGGYATRVAGFRAWQGMNRFVRKGEKAIYVLAPMVYKRTNEAPAADDERVIKGFKYVPVFDISQTDGEELPCICNRLAGDDPADLFAQLVAVAQSIGFTVEDHDFEGGTNGDCSHLEHRIRIESSNSPLQRVKTMAHELAHAMLHEKFDDRRGAELEAESTAYVVCQSLGLETSDYSFGYVATWAGDADKAVATIKGSCDRIQRTAAAIIDRLQTSVASAAPSG
jgi:antirestriction protein ArdC